MTLQKCFYKMSSAVIFCDSLQVVSWQGLKLHAIRLQSLGLLIVSAICLQI